MESKKSCKEKRKLVQKVAVDAFVTITGIYVSYCEGCSIWQVHCPDCNHNWCGGGCDCGYNTLLDRSQEKLEKVLAALNIDN